MLEIYESILNTTGFVVDDNGHVRTVLNDKSLPASIKIDDEHRMVVMPTHANLRSERVMDFVFFHPFQENLARGESRVMQFLRRELNRNFGSRVSALLLAIVDISANINHAELSAEQKDLIAKMGKIDTKLAESINRIVRALHKRNNRATPVFLSLKKAHTYKGKKHGRAAIWSFPLADEIYSVIEQSKKSKDYKPKVFGVEVRKSDLDTLKKITDVFFPHSQEENEWVGISDATDAPYMESFVRALATYPKHTNKIAETFFAGKHHVYSSEVAKSNLETVYLDVSWINDKFTVADWRKEYLLIPIQDGNEGVSPVENTTREIETKTTPKEEVNITPRSTRKWEDVTSSSQGNASKEDTPPWETKETKRQCEAPREEPKSTRTSDEEYLERLSHRPARRDYRDDRDYGYNRSSYRDEPRRRPSAFAGLYGDDNDRHHNRNDLPYYLGGRRQYDNTRYGSERHNRAFIGNGTHRNANNYGYERMSPNDRYGAIDNLSFETRVKV